MNSSRDRYLSVFLLGVLMGAFGPLTGCGGHRAGDRPKTEVAASAARSPFVEAYLEYTGPNSRWAGPPSFLMHVDARDAVSAKIEVTPNFLGEEAAVETTSVQRTLSAIGAKTPKRPSVSTETARENLETLAAAMEGAETPFVGCLSPVHVRLVRADGTLLEKRGCRSETGWTGTASRTISGFLEAVL